MKLLLATFCLLLTACSMQPNTHSVDVEVSPNRFVDLPQPSALQENVNVSQLITAQWGQGAQHKLLVQLQVDQEKVVLAGFSAWGAKLLSLTYWGQTTGNKIDTQVMSGLSEQLPKPEQVLFYVMISIWPEQAWQNRLSAIGWRLQEEGLQRRVIDENGKTVVIIDYQTKPYLAGTITLKHQALDYTVSIQTK